MSVFDGDLYRIWGRFVNPDGTTRRVSEHIVYSLDETREIVASLAARPNVSAVISERLEYVTCAPRAADMSYGDISDHEEW